MILKVLEILICVFIILVAIFYKQFRKFYDSIFPEYNWRNVHFKNKKIEMLYNIISRIIILLAGSTGLIAVLCRK